MAGAQYSIPNAFAACLSSLLFVFSRSAPVSSEANQQRLAPGRWLNGDQNHQGRHLRLPSGKFDIQRIKLYRYR
jgi:hypothetical protein